MTTLTTAPITAISLSPAAGNIRFQADDYTPAVTQHILSIPISADTSRYLVAIGTADNFHFHSVDVVLDYVSQYAAGLIPSDTLLPPVDYVLPDLFGRSAFTALLLGSDMPTVCASYGLTESMMATTIAEYAGIRIQRVTMSQYMQANAKPKTLAVEPTIDAEDDDLDSLLGEAASLTIPKSIGKISPAVVLNRPHAETLGVVRKLTDLEIAALESVMANKKLNPNPADRQSWVFKSMQVYETVCIAHERASKAQAAVHTYSQRTGRKFSTKRNHDKSLQVTRLS